MTTTFEIQKNTKALTYTLVICGLLLLISFYLKWNLPVHTEKFPPDLIEIDLGNDMDGSGDVQPLVKGTPAPTAQAQSDRISGAASAASQDVNADENDEEAATVVKVPKKNNTVTNVVSSATKPKTPSSVTSENNNASRKPKLPLYQGGLGTGGNGANEDNGYASQGTGGGSGDEGSPGGKRGIRGKNFINYFPPMQDEFNENAKIFVDITVDRIGHVTNAVILKGTTTASSSLRNIALQKAKQLRFPAGTHDSETGTIIFNFIVR